MIIYHTSEIVYQIGVGVHILNVKHTVIGILIGLVWALIAINVYVTYVYKLFFILAQWPLIAGALWLSPGSAAVEGLAEAYLRLRIWGAPATIALYAVTGWLIATERTRAVLILQIWINGVNIALDLWFVLGLGWGVVAAQCVGG